MSLAGADRGGPPTVGKVPPPLRPGSLADLSALGVVRIAGASVVAPQPAPAVVPGPRPVPPAPSVPTPEPVGRRSVTGQGVQFSPEAIAAADKYIAEREQKRLKGFDIPEHSRYNKNASVLLYAGVRNIDGHSLALLRRDDSDSIMVVPVDQATARRLSRIAVGDPVSLTPKGSIKTSRGRGR